MGRPQISDVQKAQIIANVPLLIEIRQEWTKIQKETPEERANRRAREAAAQASGDNTKKLPEVKQIAESIGVSTAKLTQYTNFALFHSYETLVEKGTPVRPGSLSVDLMCNIVEFSICTKLEIPYINALFSKTLSSLDRFRSYRNDIGHRLADKASVSAFIPNENGVVEAYPTWNVAFIDEMVRERTGKSLREVLIEHEKALREDSEKHHFETLEDLNDLHKYNKYLKNTADDLGAIELVIKAASQHKTTKPTIDELAKQIGSNKTDVAEKLRFIRFHGAEELRQMPSMRYSCPYTREEMSCILDFREAFCLTTETTATIFKIYPKIITNAIAERKNSGRIFPPLIANVPESTNLEVLKQEITKRAKTTNYEFLAERFYKQHGLSPESAIKNAYLANRINGDNPDTNGEDMLGITSSSYFSNPFHCGIINHNNKKYDPIYAVYSSLENRSTVCTLPKRVSGKAKRLNAVKTQERRYTYQQREKKSQADEQKALNERYGYTPLEFRLDVRRFQFYQSNFATELLQLKQTSYSLYKIELPIHYSFLNDSIVVSDFTCLVQSLHPINSLSKIALAASIVKEIDAQSHGRYVENKYCGECDLVAPDDITKLVRHGKEPYSTSFLAYIIDTPSCYSSASFDFNESSYEAHGGLDITDLVCRNDALYLPKYPQKSEKSLRRKDNALLQQMAPSEHTVDGYHCSNTSDNLSVSVDNAEILKAKCNAEQVISNLAEIEAEGDFDYNNVIGSLELREKVLNAAQLNRDKLDPEDPLGARDQFLVEYGYDIGLSARDYKANYADKSQRGRKPIINPFSKGFDELDQNDQLRSLIALRNVIGTSLYIKKNLNKVYLPEYDYEYAADISARRVQLYNEIVATMPKWMLKQVVAHMLNLSSGMIQYHNKFRDRDNTKRYINAAILDEAVKKVQHENNSTFGAAKMAAYLDVHMGICHNEETVRRAMQRTGCCFVKLHKTNSTVQTYIGENQYVAPNRTGGIFQTSKPFMRVDTDMSFFKCNDGMLVLGAWIDDFNGEVLTAAIATTPCQKMVMDCQEELLARVPSDARCMIHTDRGAPYMAKEFAIRFDNDPRFIRSMSGKGQCIQNGAIESLHAKIREEVIARIPKPELTLQRVRDELLKWLHFYNNERPTAKCRGLAPVVFKNIYDLYNQDPLFALAHHDLSYVFETKCVA